MPFFPRITSQAKERTTTPVRSGNTAATFWQVIFPLAVPGLIVGAVLVFTGSFTSYATPQLLGGERQMMMGTFLYQNAMVHAKTATVDGQWSTIGTANLDRLSLHGNYEINAEIFNEAVARQMETIFEVDSSNTVELTWERWRARHPLAKVSEAVLSPFRPLL